MTEILLRAGKDPFTVLSPAAALDEYPSGVFGKNVGNLVFSDSMHRILSVPGTEVVANTFLSEREGVTPAYTDAINERFDQFVVPLANAFRMSFLANLNRMTETIEALDIPVTVVGVGVSGGARSLDRDLLDVPPELVSGVKAFMNAVLDRSATVGVRGENTSQFLRRLGYSDAQVDVIGCPSLFRYGTDLRIDKTLPKLKPDSRISINISPYVPVMARIAKFHGRKYERLEYIPQDVDTLRLLLRGSNPDRIINRKMPVHDEHPFYAEDRMWFFVDSRTWIDHLAEMDFSFGTRIHGNIAALVAGTPAHVLVHDTRTQELAEYHQIPHTKIADLPERVDAARLYEEADYTDFNAGHRGRFENFCAFLAKNRIEHIFEEGNAHPEYDQRLANLELPPAVHRGTTGTLHTTRDEDGGLQQTKNLDAYRFRAPVPHIRESRVSSILARAVRKLRG